MNTPKWIPKQNNDIIKLFEHTRQLERYLRVLGKKFATNINLDFPDYYEFEQLLNQCKKCFDISCDSQQRLIKLCTKSTDKNIERSSYKVLLVKKSFVIRQNLKKRHFQLMFIINRIIRLMLGTVINSDVVIDAALLLCSIHNECVQTFNLITKSGGRASICNNTFPGLMSQPKIIDVGMILQTISRHRSEQCCLTLISCLLITCKTEIQTDDDTESSSVEVLKALTTHLSSPIQQLSKDNLQKQQQQQQQQNYNTNKLSPPGEKFINNMIPSDSETNDQTIKFFDNMANDLTQFNQINTYNNLDGIELLEQLVADEETNIANILLKCIKLCPSVFEITLNKKELTKWVDYGIRNLWIQIGSTLENIVLWWSNSPLACRASNCTKYLRDWLLLIQPEDAPEPILSTLRNLAETLTVHVTGTTWDKQFRLTLVSSSLPVDYSFDNTEFVCVNTELQGTNCGRLWSELLYTLSTFCNSCDQNGTIPKELPIVEQIIILHRLDHSVHTMRLWAAGKAKSLCTEWNMKMFFRVVHNDITLCLTQLQSLRFPQLVSTDLFEVHLQVCVALRAKLISEIKVNVQKLKQTTTECIEILASICSTMSLATLSLCFPSSKLWQTDVIQSKSNEYVTYLLEQIYLPVLEATNDPEILSLILKILCENWLDHIYMKKVKFSRCGAINLLRDFDGVSEWIETCEHVPVEQSEKLAKHEVLRMCEGVGRILLRKPQDIISMLPSTHLIRHEYDEKEEKAQQLPPEMFVPNQQRWLELRARNRNITNYLCLCPSISILNE